MVSGASKTIWIITRVAEGFPGYIASGRVARTSVSSFVNDKAELVTKLELDQRFAIADSFFIFIRELIPGHLDILPITHIEECVDGTKTEVQDAGTKFQRAFFGFEISIGLCNLTVRLVADWT